ncbi:MAG: T9SS type A sorting domain-containing protein, partial [Flavobacteriales bacterium]|nr:T9SS type A sorting domain-containing protein [Flavobacteriales bacterium]
FLLVNVNGQNTVWVEQGKAPKTERGNAITHDNNGNLYITGAFQDSVRLDSILLTEQYGNYCAKYDTTGNIIWAYKNLGGSGVTFDGSSYIYLFNNNNLTLQKVGLDGTVSWSNSLFTSSTFGSCGIQDVYVKGSDVYVTGFYSGNACFFSDTLINASSSGWDIFIAKYNSSGVFQWAKTAGGAGLDKGYDIYVNNLDEIFAIGYFKDDAYFETTHLISNGLQDMYIAKYNSSGNLLWAYNYGGTGFDLAAKIITDDNNYLYVMGRYNNSITFGTTTLNSTGTDAFIAKFDSNGNPIWAKGISGTGEDEEADIDYENGRIAFIATTSGNVSINSSTLSGLGDLDICIGHLDTTGAVIWAKLFGGLSDDEGSGVTLLMNSTYFSGSFKTTANFDAFSLTSLGQWDIVIGKIDNQITTGLFQLETKEFQISIYPNPATNDFNILFSEEQNHVTVTLTDILGNKIKEIIFDGKHLVIPTEYLKAGIYLISVKDEYNNGINRKIVIQ